MLNKSQKTGMLLSACIVLLFLSLLFTWSMFRVQLMAEFPTLTAAQLSMNFSIATIGFCLGGFFGGKMSQRWNQRVSVRVAAVLVFIGFYLCSFMEGMAPEKALAVLYIGYGALGGLGVGIGYNACISGSSPWFPERLGLVSGVLLMCYGFGSLLLGLIVERLTPLMGVYNVFRLSAVVLAAIMVIGSFFLHKPVAKAGTEETGLTPGQMLCRPSFWVYFIWNTVAASSGLLVINSSANIALAFGTAASLGMIVSLFNGAGRPVTGAIMDRLGQFKGMLIMNSVLLLGGILLVLAAKTGLAIAVFLGMIFVGICYGGGVTISARVISDLYGPKHYGVNFSLSNFCMIPAAFIGPYISGVLQDRSGGKYDSTFLMVTVMALIALAAVFVLKWLIAREQKKNG